MFDTVFDRLTRDCFEVRKRPEGVAFFKAAKELYGFSSISYLGLNIHVPARKGCFIHCAYADSYVKHCVTQTPLPPEALSINGLTGSAPFEWGGTAGVSSRHDATDDRSMAFPLRTRGSETSFLCINAQMPKDDWERQKAAGMRDIRVLGNYFHSHVLRINGHDSGIDMIVSARELDCLKWTAAGKTAWEASVILGISERTVRFHLNAAREKLACATTTQAVAKAISYQLIDI